VRCNPKCTGAHVGLVCWAACMQEFKLTGCFFWILSHCHMMFQRRWEASDFIGEGDQDDLPPGWGQDADDGDKAPSITGPSNDKGSCDDTQPTRAPTPEEQQPAFLHGAQGSRRTASGLSTVPCSVGGVQRGTLRSLPSLFTNAQAAPREGETLLKPPRPPLAEAARQRLPYSVRPPSGSAAHGRRSRSGSRSSFRGQPSPVSLVDEDPGSVQVRATLESLKAAKSKGASLEEVLDKVEALQHRARSLPPPAPATPAVEGDSLQLRSRAAAAASAASRAAAASAQATVRSDRVRLRCDAEAEHHQRERAEFNARLEARASLATSQQHSSQVEADSEPRINPGGSLPSIPFAARSRRRAASAPATGACQRSALPPIAPVKSEKRSG